MFIDIFDEEATKQRIEESKKKEKFECRICGSTEYTKNIESNGIDGEGYSERIIDYECAKCSIKFGNLEKFSVHLKT